MSDLPSDSFIKQCIHYLKHKLLSVGLFFCEVLDGGVIVCCCYFCASEEEDGGAWARRRWRSWSRCRRLTISAGDVELPTYRAELLVT